MAESIKRIAVFGPESTGKTSLAEHLAVHFGLPLVPEYAREFWDWHGGIALADMLPIAREQWRREDEAAVRSTNAIICDTEALTTMLWSDLLYGTCPEELRRVAEQRAKGYALYLLLDIDVPFAADPQRCFPEPAERKQAMRIWRGALKKRGLPFVLIQGNWDERRLRATDAVDQLIRRQGYGEW